MLTVKTSPNDCNETTAETPLLPARVQLRRSHRQPRLPCRIYLTRCIYSVRHKLSSEKSTLVHRVTIVAFSPETVSCGTQDTTPPERTTYQLPFFRTHVIVVLLLRGFITWQHIHSAMPRGPFLSPAHFKQRGCALFRSGHFYGTRVQWRDTCDVQHHAERM